MVIATWNVNSLKARLERALAWLERQGPDVVCLQELKLSEAQFPYEPIQALGYHAVVHGQPTYNGVAILCREPPTEVRVGLGDGVANDQARLVSALVGGVRVLSAYFPNGQAVGSEKWDYKLAWMARLEDHLRWTYDPAEPLALCGDFNVAPSDLDVARPDEWRDSVLCHEEARAGLATVQAWGLVDVFRRLHPEARAYTWWDYRQLAFPKGNGLRIDHVYTTAALAERCVEAVIDRDERKGEKPSDHAPLRVRFAAR